MLHSAYRENDQSAPADRTSELTVNEAIENRFPHLPTFTEAFPSSTFYAPVADIVVGGIEGGFSVALGVGGTVCLIVPEIWPISYFALPASVDYGIDAWDRVTTGIQRLNGGR